MLYMPKIDDYLNILTAEEVKFFVSIKDLAKTCSQNRKQKFLSALAFLVMKIKKNIQSMYQKNGANKNMLTYY